MSCAVSVSSWHRLPLQAPAALNDRCLKPRPITGSLTVSCEPRGDALDCHAIGRSTDDRDDPRAETDLTDAVVWSTSNAQAVAVLKGRVTARHLGVATIMASLRSGNETLSSSVVIVVDEEGARPKVAYDLKGVVRDLANTGITDVEVELTPVVDHQRAAPRKASTVIDGAFQFSPILGGQYRLIATKGGYRPVERRLKVPDATAADAGADLRAAIGEPRAAAGCRALLTMPGLWLYIEKSFAILQTSKGSHERYSRQPSGHVLRRT